MGSDDGGELVRIRSIKPEFWRSSAISSLPIEDRLLFIGLWSYVDDNSVGKDKLSAIAADLFADDLERDAPETFARVSRGLARLSEGGRIVRYTVAGEDYLRVVNWSEHQRIDKPGKARYPSDDAEEAVIRESVANVRETPATGAGEQGSRGADIFRTCGACFRVRTRLGTLAEKGRAQEGVRTVQDRGGEDVQGALG